MKNFTDDVPQYVLATFKDRFLAFFLDVSILFVFSFPISMSIAAIEGIVKVVQGGTLNSATSLVFVLVRVLTSLGLGYLYYGYFYKRRGASLGKDILNLKVVCLPYTHTPAYKTALLRDVLGKLLSAFTLFIGYLIVLFRNDRRALHDLVADTVILKRIR